MVTLFISRTPTHRPKLASATTGLATIAHGDGVCTTCIPDPPTSSNQKEKVTS